MSADRVLIDSEFHTVGAATEKERDAIDVSTHFIALLLIINNSCMNKLA